MSTIKENVEALNQMILSGDILGAFEKFYADDVVMQDNEMPARQGKAECRTFEESFVNNSDRISRGEGWRRTHQRRRWSGCHRVGL